MPVLNQDFSGLDQEGEIENTNMTAKWQQVQVAGKNGVKEKKFYLFVKPKHHMMVQGDFKIKCSIGAETTFYLWMNVAAIIWNKQLKEFDNK